MLSSTQLASQTTFSLISVFFERTGYYGLRSIILLFLVSETIQMKKADVIFFYGIFVMVVGLFRPIGGLLADFVLGIKLAAVLGLGISAMACFAFAYSNIFSPYLGLVLLVLGNGLYAPANMVHLLRIYDNKKKKVDGALSLQYFAVNLGAFLGPLLIGVLIVDLDNFRNGFYVAAGLLIVGMVFALLFKEQPINIHSSKKAHYSSGFRFSAVLILIVAMIAYWFFYTLVNNHIYGQSMLGMVYSSFDTIQLVCRLIIAAVLGVIWYFVYVRGAWKVTTGLFLSAIAIVFLIFVGLDKNLLIFVVLTSNILFALSEILFIGYVYPIIQRFSNPKYLTTIIGCAMGLVSFLATLFSDLINTRGSFVIILSLVLMFVMAIVSLVFTIVYKPTEQESEVDLIDESQMLDQL